MRRDFGSPKIFSFENENHLTAMFQDKYVFAQLTAFLNRTQFNNYVRKYDGNLYVKHFTCWNQLLAMMFGHLPSERDTHPSPLYLFSLYRHFISFLISDTLPLFLSLNSSISSSVERFLIRSSLLHLTSSLLHLPPSAFRHQTSFLALAILLP